MFKVKEWQNGAAGGTPTNAAAFKDLEKRLSAYTDEQVVAALASVLAPGQVAEPELVWSYRMPGTEPCYSSPIVTQIGATRVVVVQSWDWYVYVLNLADGTLRWRYAFDDVNYGRAQAADVNGDGRLEIIAASHDGTARCLDDAGALLWTHYNLYGREGSGTATGGTLYSLVDTSQNWEANSFVRNLGQGYGASVEITAGTGVGETQEISGSDPTVLWTYDPFGTAPDATSQYVIHPRYTSDPNYQHAGTLVQEGGAWFLYITGFDSQVVKVNASDGTVVWKFSGLESIEPYPIVLDVDGDGATEVCAACVDGHVYCLNSQTGAQKWAAQADEINGAPLDSFLQAADIDGDGLIEVIASCRSNRVYVVNGVDGSIKAQSTDMAADADARPALFDAVGGRRAFAVGSDSGYVYCCNPDGTTRWRNGAAIGVGFNSSPSVVDVNLDGSKELVIADMSGTVDLLDADGRSRGQLHAPGAIEGTPLVADVDGDGRVEIVLTTLDGYVQVYRW